MVKVWDMNRKTEKALDTLVILYSRFEQVSKDLGEVDPTFDEEFEEYCCAGGPCKLCGLPSGIMKSPKMT